MLKVVLSSQSDFVNVCLSVCAREQLFEVLYEELSEYRRSKQGS